MSKALTIAIALLAACLLCGCKSMSEAWKGDGGGSAAGLQKSPDAASTQQGDTSANADDSSDKHNALLDNEDEASKARRERARKSLGL